ncbi:ABC transporter substrate-binding protein [Paenibacillus planticolens]|uniref:ABC transporter substrate-binding protein n=1 Tax=Paenibacillus planticolens TaxID=2654976 RepID=A0ABX1ZH45_9BACL|nr:ABC transporter substrate-binding protein [Paenibacillus planticolens]NOU99416.1 ABC transporter substrate-binding protein [Paenibacillus planticolens]
MKNIHCVLLSTLLIGLLSGCAASPPQSPDNSQQASSGSLSVTDFAGRKVTFSKVPTKVAALSNGEMDIVYALGGELVGRPTSTAPLSNKEVAKIEQVGTPHGMDLEKVALVQPDVILGNNPLNLKDVPAIESLGSKMILTDANSVAEIQKQIGLFGEVLGKKPRADEQILAIDKKIGELQKNLPEQKIRALLVYGAPGTYMAALGNSLSGDILSVAGGENIAADYPSLDKYPQYAQLNTEKIMKSNPQVIFFMGHGDTDKVKEGFLKEMQQNAAWNSLDAVKNNRIEVLPSDLFGSNPGTRVIESLELMHKLLLSSK